MKIPDPEQVTAAPDGRPQDQQPKWRRDFPIDWPQDEYVARRDLIKFLLLTGAAFVGGHTWLVQKKLSRQETRGLAPRAIAPVAELPIGGARTFEYPAGSPPRLLVRLGEDRFAAYDQQCTHLLCPVLPALERGRLRCPCHNGWFDAATGQPIAGPPRRPLPRVLVEVRAGVVYATGVEEGAP